MTILVVGASGATGRLLVQHLLQSAHRVTIVVRSTDNLPDETRSHKNLTVCRASILDLTGDEINQIVSGCTAVACCLGHNLTAKGMFGRPRRLVTDAVRRLCDAIKAGDSTKPVKFVLMNTTGNRNRDLNEPISFAHRLVVGLIRLLLPPHADNEDAANYLRSEIGQKSGRIQWAVVRPDTLTNEAHPTQFEVHASPTRSAIFDAGKTSRINVACFMADLIEDDAVWSQWQGKMPVIYNKTPEAKPADSAR